MRRPEAPPKQDKQALSHLAMTPVIKMLKQGGQGVEQEQGRAEDKGRGR